MTTVNIGKGIEIEVDFTAFPTMAIDHIQYIGIRNILMDSHAGINAKVEPDLSASDIIDQSRATAEKKLAALLRGEVRVASTREGNPVRAEALRMATDIVKAKVRKAGKKISDYEPKAIREAAAKLITPELLEAAKARVEEVADADSNADLADLGLYHNEKGGVD